MDNSINRDLELACLTVQRASKLTKLVLASVDKGAQDKKDNSPVTIADFAAQALIISAIHHVFPDDGFVGEETSTALRENPELLKRVWGLVSSFSSEHLREGTAVSEKDLNILSTPSTPEEMLDLIDLGGKGQGGSKGRIWVLDPVDGTATFIQGQQYVVCLALLEHGQQRLGVLGCPNLPVGASQVHEDIVDREGDGQMVFAIAGHGAFTRPMDFSSIPPTSSSSAAAAAAAGCESLLKPAVPLPKIAASSLKPSDVRFVDCEASGSTNPQKHALVASKLGAPWPATVSIWSSQMRYIAIAVGAGASQEREEEGKGGNTLIKIPRDESYRSCVWDHAGGMLIAQEVGCVVTDVHGRTVNCGLGRTLADSVGLVVAPASIHSEVLRAVKEVVNGDV